MAMPTKMPSDASSIRSIPKLRKSADSTKTSTTQPVLPYTGKDFSSESINSAMMFKMTHEYPDWHKRAECGKPQYDQEMFFGGDELPGKRRHRPTMTMSEVQRAKAICNTCPVMLACQTYALEHHEEFGIWGGTTKRDRDRWWKEQGVHHMDSYVEAEDSSYVEETDFTFMAVVAV